MDTIIEIVLRNPTWRIYTYTESDYSSPRELVFTFGQQVGDKVYAMTRAIPYWELDPIHPETIGMRLEGWEQEFKKELEDAEKE